MDGGANVFADIARSFLSLLDRMVYFFIDLLISLFDSLASIRIFGNDAIATLTTRIYALIAIIMIFKVSFSIIQYIINPDNFSDKERGFGKTIRNVILTLVALVITPYIFNLAYNIQNYATQHQLVEKIILGVNNTTAEKQRNSKNEFALRILNIFVQPNITEIKEFSYKNNRYYCMENDRDNPMFNDLGEYNEGFGDCLWHLDGNQDGKNYQYNGKTYDADDSIYNLVWESNDYAILLDMVDDRYNINNTIYLFDYKFLISTAVGVFVLIMYLNFCIDLAIRSVKFAFLQLIAPIPIISMIDPKSSKSGPMSKWLNVCFSTYIGLFIRIAAVSFVIVVINIVFSSSVLTTNGTQINDFIKLVIVLGALLFAKDLPKLLSDIIGVNFGGEFKLNPLLRIPGGRAALNAGRTLAGATTAGLIGGIAGGIAANNAHRQLGHSGGLTTGGTIRGALQGIGSGFAGGIKNHGQHFVQAGATAAKAQSTRVRENDGLTFGQRTRKFFGNAVGVNTEDMDKSAEYQRSLNRGQKLYEDYMKPDSNGDLKPDYAAMFGNDTDFANTVISFERAKQNKIMAEAYLEDLKRRSTHDPNSVSQDEMAKADKAVATYKQNLKIMQDEIDNKKGTHMASYKKYTDFKTYKDHYEAMNSGVYSPPSGSISNGATPSGSAPSGSTSSGPAPSSHSSSSTIDYSSINMGPMSNAEINYSSIDMSEPSSGTTSSRPAPSSSSSSSTIDYGSIDMGSPSSTIVTNGTSHTSVSSQSNNTTGTTPSGTTSSTIVTNGTSHTSVSSQSNNTTGTTPSGTTSSTIVTNGTSHTNVSGQNNNNNNRR